MISYRKLAMRVLGHPLRVPTPPRPASHRVTALALTAAMVAGMAAPAYADVYYIGDGNITITKDENGTQRHSTVQQHRNKDDGPATSPSRAAGEPRRDTASGRQRSSGSSSSEGTTPAKSPAQSNLTTLPLRRRQRQRSRRQGLPRRHQGRRRGKREPDRRHHRRREKRD